MLFVRQGATHKVPIGPAVAVGDGFTPTAALDLSTADTAYAILHDNATAIDISGYTMAAVANATGQYLLTLQSAISGTVGQMRITITDDSLMLPLIADFTILDTAAYDAMYKDAAEGPLQATTVGRKLDVSAAGAAGIDWANVEGKTATVGLTNTTVGITTVNSDMRGTDGVDTSTMRGTDGVDTSTMRGTDGANTTTPPTVAAIADAVLDELVAGHTDPGSMSQAIIDILADTDEIQGDQEDDGRLDVIWDAIKVETDKLGADMPDSIAADGVIGTPIQALYLIKQFLTEFEITDVSYTVKKVNGTTTLVTFTINSATTPTSMTR